ncbi:MAG: hypothetical protein JW778_00680 [Candidatus Altiarchaeota archaeon]|nr:hypothetical protein [Candidatus Altiarchaeota archaeon]
MIGRVKYGLLLLLLYIIMGAASAQLGGNLSNNDSESATITVNISHNVMVDITPAAFSWGAIAPGTEANSTHEASGYFGIQIENVGSANITHVWFNATYPLNNPFGTGNSSAIDAGNFVVLSKNTSATDYWFINRVEYNTTAELVYLKDPDGNMPPNDNKYIYGRFHKAGDEYFWMINNNTNCTTGGTNIYIGNTSHSKTQTGTTNFQTGDVESFGLTALPDYSFAYADITDGPLDGLCVAVDFTCTRVFFSRWNADSPFHLCANVNYAYDYNVEGTPLVPGDSFAMGIKAYVPYGIYEGSSSGKITAIVNDVA